MMLRGFVIIDIFLSGRGKRLKGWKARQNDNGNKEPTYFQPITTTDINHSESTNARGIEIGRAGQVLSVMMPCGGKEAGGTGPT